jgi:hypothetical protein
MPHSAAYWFNSEHRRAVAEGLAYAQCPFTFRLCGIQMSARTLASRPECSFKQNGTPRASESDVGTATMESGYSKEPRR